MWVSGLSCFVRFSKPTKWMLNQQNLATMTLSVDVAGHVPSGVRLQSGPEASLSVKAGLMKTFLTLSL
jgi:hypothetical protein